MQTAKLVISALAFGLLCLGYWQYLNHGCESMGIMTWQGRVCVEDLFPDHVVDADEMVEAEPEEEPLAPWECDLRSGNALYLSERQCDWAKELAMCESTNDETAINWLDRDGTPSYGLYQFKPATFAHYLRKYTMVAHLTPETVIESGAILDRVLQDATLAGMLLDWDNIDWRQQFPVCIAKIGMPPYPSK